MLYSTSNGRVAAIAKGITMGPKDRTWVLLFFREKKKKANGASRVSPCGGWESARGLIGASDVL